MATVMVVGGAGYVGSHACKALAAAGHRPVTYDNLSRGHRHAVKWGPLEVGDLNDPVRLAEAFDRHRPAAVMHFAALAYVGESMTDPSSYYRNNVAGTLTLLDAMRRAGVGVLVFSSTCATYGIPQTVPVPEDHPQAPINPYGASKLMMERAIADFAMAYGLRAAVLRYFNVAGADPDGEIGEEHEPETHAIPLVLFAALGRIPAFTVNGRDYDTPDGTAIRDYIHVADLAEAHCRALERLLGGAAGFSLNLGTGRGCSVAELVATAGRLTGRPVPVVDGPRRPGDPPVLVADPACANRLLGWRPRFDTVDAMMRTALDWYARPTAGGRPV